MPTVSPGPRPPLRFGPPDERIAVAIVEDDSRYRAALAHAVLSSHRLCLAGVAHDVASARRLLQRATADVLLVDLGLPDGSGMDVIRHAATVSPRCEVMVLTGVADADQLLAAIAAGANGYVLKEESDAGLVEHIEALRAGGSPISPLLARRLLSRLQAGGAVAVDDGEAPALSERERAVLRMVSRGTPMNEIADALGVSRSTVQTYVKRSYRKLQVHSSNAAVYEARRLGWLAGEPAAPNHPAVGQ